MQDANLQTEKAEEYKAPTEETAWSRIKKALGPFAVVGVVIKIFGETQIRAARPVEVRRHHAADGLGVHATMGLAVRDGFVLLLRVHETGHLIVAKKFGLKVGAPVSIPFMDAFIALKEAPRNA